MGSRFILTRLFFSTAFVVYFHLCFFFDRFGWRFNPIFTNSAKRKMFNGLLACYESTLVVYLARKQLQHQMLACKIFHILYRQEIHLQFSFFFTQNCRIHLAVMFFTYTQTHNEWNKKESLSVFLLFLFLHSVIQRHVTGGI